MADDNIDVKVDGEDEAPIAPEIKPSWYWVKDAKGRASVSTTLVLIAFIATTVAYILSIVSKIGPVEIRAFDVGAAGVYLSPLLLLYFGRRATEAKTESSKN